MSGLAWSENVGVDEREALMDSPNRCDCSGYRSAGIDGSEFSSFDSHF